MAIYIKGATMPKCCADCDPDFGIAIGCDKWKNGKFNFIKERPNDCPLTEVPEPHGRLIDVDTVGWAKHIPDVGYLSQYQEGWNGGVNYMLGEIDDAPTVIEGSE